MADSDDEDLKRAIALSLGEAERFLTPVQKTRKDPVVIDISGDTDSETESDEVPEVLKASNAERLPVASSVDRIQPSNSKVAPLGSSDFDTLTARSSLTEAFGGLSRKEMEEERLARLKRRLSISPPPLRRAPGTLKSPKKVEGVESVRRVGMVDIVGRFDAADSSEAVLDYPDGVFKKTWAFGFVRENDIKIEEVLQKHDLNIAVLSAFQWDIDWLFRKLDLGKTKMMFVVQAKDEATKALYRSNTRHIPNIRLCFPSMTGNINCMHSKLQLLFHKDYLRIAIPSANLTPYDWGETGVLENSVFLIDLLRKPNHEHKQTRDTLPFFGQELLRFLDALGLDKDVIDGVLNFNFDRTKHLAFIHTIGGSHSNENWKYTGYCGLGRAVREMGLTTKGPIEVDFVTSSVGSLGNDPDLPLNIYLAAHGIDPLLEYSERVSKTKKSKSIPNSTKYSDHVLQFMHESMKSHFRAYFPSLDTVKASRGGTGQGGTICLKSDYWMNTKFPKHIFRDCKSRRSGLLMHNKMLFARSPEILLSPIPGYGCSAWAYHGSANLSESAWGRLVKDTATKAPKLNCRNWECGVLIPILEAEDTAKKGTPTKLQRTSAADVTAFEKHVPFPMQVPAEEFRLDMRPWFFTEPHYW